MTVSSETLYRWRERILEMLPVVVVGDDGEAATLDACTELQEIADEMLEHYPDAIRRECA